MAETPWLVKYIIAFVSVHSKELNTSIRLLFSTLTRGSTSFDSKGSYVAPKLCKDGLSTSVAASAGKRLVIAQKDQHK